MHFRIAGDAHCRSDCPWMDKWVRTYYIYAILQTKILWNVIFQIVLYIADVVPKCFEIHFITQTDFWNTQIFQNTFYDEDEKWCFIKSLILVAKTQAWHSVILCRNINHLLPRSTFSKILFYSLWKFYDVWWVDCLWTISPLPLASHEI